MSQGIVGHGQSRSVPVQDPACILAKCGELTAGMGHEGFQLTILHSLLEGDLRLAQVFGLPEIPAVGEPEPSCREILKTKARAHFEDPELDPARRASAWGGNAVIKTAAKADGPRTSRPPYAPRHTGQRRLPRAATSLSVAVASNLAGRTEPLNRVLVVTGSGISAESGIPTFRGPGGHWRNFDPTQLATETAFRRDPTLVWEWYRERRAQIRACRPNAAHEAVVRMAASAGACLVLTQNVDDLHQRATWEGQRLRADQLIQIHGNLFVTRCSRCTFRTPATDAEIGVPRCPQCDAPLRPGVVWFGEQLDSDDVDRVEAFVRAGDAALVVVIGTTALFGYIVSWARTARGPAGRLIEVNPEATPLSPFADETLRLPATRALPDLVARWLNR